MTVVRVSVFLFLASCSCAESHNRDAATDAPFCPDPVVFVRACGSAADPCASVCACEEDFVLERCELDENGSCLANEGFCDSIERGRTFQSIDELECGLGPGGVALCKWEISFRAGDFEWTYSDIGESGTYTCASDHATSRDYAGTWDTARERLTWDGVEYELLPLSCPD